MASATKLSTHDCAVLGALFDPEGSISGSHQLCPSDKSTYDDWRFKQIQQAEHDALIYVNTKNPSPEDRQHSIDLLDRVIECNPRYASAYNNRAQARRMNCDIEELTSRPDTLNSIMADLEMAIRLASPEQLLEPVSPHTAKVLVAAYTHRAFLLYRGSKLKSPSTALALVKEMSGLDREHLEELASRDFANAGRYGDNTAKQMAVKTNPYAKLCGSIVKEAMRGEVGTSRWQHPVNTRLSSGE